MFQLQFEPFVQRVTNLARVRVTVRVIVRVMVMVSARVRVRVQVGVRVCARGSLYEP